MRFVLGAAAVLTGLAGAGLHAANAASGRVVPPSFWLMGLVASLAYGGAALAVHRSPATLLRRLLGAVGLTEGASLLAQEWARFSPTAPLQPWSLWLGSWLWAAGYVAILTVLPLLLPEGRLLSTRWRPTLALSGVSIAASSLWWALLPYPLQDFPEGLAGAVNPVGVEAVASAPVSLPVVGVLLAAVATAAASLVLRWRRATGVERQQLKWVVLGMGATLSLVAAAQAVPVGAVDPLAALAMLPLPLTIGVAVLRHGLWHVDVVLSRSLAYAALVAIAAVLYLAVGALLGGVLGPSTGALVAAGLILLLVLALHGPLQRQVNRWVHGDPDEPLVALIRLGERLSAAADPEDLAGKVLPSVVARVCRALRATQARLTLRDGTVVVHGAAAKPTAPGEIELPVESGGEELGVLSLTRPGGFSRADRRVLERLAQQTGVAAHAVLLAREARRARESVILAREDERRRLRHDLHDGLGPSLAAVALHVETARDLAAHHPATAIELLDALVPRLTALVADVRALVHELRPPNLDELGLAAAVRELCVRLSTPTTRVHVQASPLGALPAAVEVAAYRIAGEAATNAVRHASASRVDVVLRRAATLVVEVSDDGHGLPRRAGANGAGGPPRGGARRGLGLQSMRQRAEELGGSLTVTSSPSGTRVVAELPPSPACYPEVGQP